MGHIFETLILETNDLNINLCSLIITSIEVLNKRKYMLIKYKSFKIIDCFNYMKIGFIFVIIIDALKLGS
nr:hypothetical protein CspTHAL103_094 [Cyanidium sp. THAL103]